MKSLTLKERCLIGLTLFSMFFGAGNLIFPPHLGSLAGSSTILAMAGFCLTAVAFPILGVMAVARSGDLNTLAGRVNPTFAFLFTLLIYLSIGPCLAIPRTASTSFEMAIAPFFTGADALTGTFMGMEYGTIAQALYSVVFFAVAGTIALDPAKLTQRLGKILSPMLLTLITVLFVATLFNPLTSQYSQAIDPFAATPFFRGFIDGYQTMDTIAALNFGLIIAMNIRAFGVKDNNAVIAETFRAGLIAAVLFLTVYGSLAYIGAQAGGAGHILANGAQTLTAVARAQFGSFGMLILGAAFFIACLNTCIGLLSCCSNYFMTIMPRPGYRGWLAIFVISSMIISNAGLTLILKLSIPVLIAIYPIALVLIVLALIHPMIARFPRIYPISILLTGIASCAAAVKSAGFTVPVLTDLLNTLPLSDVGLEWIFPTLIGALIGVAADLVCKK